LLVRGRETVLLIDNDVVAAVLTTKDRIEVQERAFAGMLTGASVCRPRLDTFVPCERDDGYDRSGSIEGATDGVHAVRLKSDIMTWPKYDARVDVIVRQGDEAFDLPETGQFRRDLGHSRSAFVAGTPKEQKRLPPVPRKQSAGRAGPFHADVIAGHAPGRSSPEQITQYRPVGNRGLQFAARGALAYRAAKARGLGRVLPTECFVRSIKN
jgi:hypothetical protein